MAIIGISGSILKEASGMFAGYPKAYVNDDYVDSVIKAHGAPVILPVTTDEVAIKTIVDAIDGLILSGGHDVDPDLYHEDPLRNLGEIFPDRDFFDFKLLEYAKAKGIPILGICRGSQIINVYHGGSLYQDLAYMDTNLPIGHSQKSGPTITTHSITIDKDSKAFGMIGKESLEVNSFHHQVLKNIGDTLKVVGRANDGAPEIIESTTYPWLVAVQFHPEMLHRVHPDMQEIFNVFVREASK